MQFQIDAKITVDIKFQTEPATPTLLSSFEYIENTQIGLPTCQIKLNCRDSDLEFVRTSLYDLAPFSVEIRHSIIDFPYNLNLVVFGAPDITPSTTTDEGYDITVHAILNTYKFLVALPATSYKGSVSGVLTRLGKECDLSVDIITTGDSQVWYSHGRTYFTFANHLCDYSFINPTALPIIGVTHPKTLIFKDLTGLLAANPKHQLEYLTKATYAGTEVSRENKAIEKNSYVFASYQAKNLAGLYNALGSYGKTFLQKSVQTSQDFESSTVTFNRRTPVSEINKKGKSIIKEVNYQHLPLDVGNTYNNYYKAYAKNQRLRYLYSNVLKVVTINEYTKIRLLDTVKVSIDQKFEDSKEEVYSGNYVVTGKTINITRNIFRELITLTNHGRNLKNNSML
jgi:hypothetical protein